MSNRRRKQTRTHVDPAVADLLQHGWCLRDAEHLMLIERALSTVGIIGTEAGRVLSDHVARALAREPVVAGASTLYAEPHHGAGWRALAGYHEDIEVRALMLQLAAASDGRDVVEAGALALSAEDLRLAAAAIDAENRGEFAEALRLLGMSRRPLDDSWTRDLERVVTYGDQLTPAKWGRWICSAALRWCQSTSRGLELGVVHASTALRALGASEEFVMEHAPARSAYDQIVHDALLFDEAACERSSSWSSPRCWPARCLGSTRGRRRHLAWCAWSQAPNTVRRARTSSAGARSWSAMSCSRISTRPGACSSVASSTSTGTPGASSPPCRPFSPMSAQHSSSPWQCATARRPDSAST